MVIHSRCRRVHNGKNGVLATHVKLPSNLPNILLILTKQKNYNYVTEYINFACYKMFLNPVLNKTPTLPIVNDHTYQ